MKRKSITTAGTLLGLTTLLTFSSLADEKKSESKEITLQETPELVQADLKERQGEAKLDEVKKIVNQEGATLYKIELDLPNEIDWTLFYDEAGKLVKEKKEILLTDTPQVIQDAVKAKLGDKDKVDEVSLVTKGEKVSYAVEIDREEQPDLVLILDSEGKIVKERED